MVKTRVAIPNKAFDQVVILEEVVVLIKDEFEHINKLYLANDIILPVFKILILLFSLRNLCFLC